MYFVYDFHINDNDNTNNNNSTMIHANSQVTYEKTNLWNTRSNKEQIKNGSNRCYFSFFKYL